MNHLTQFFKTLIRLKDVQEPQQPPLDSDVLYMRSSTGMRRWKIESSIDPKSSTPQFNWTREKTVK